MRIKRSEANLLTLNRIHAPLLRAYPEAALREDVGKMERGELPIPTLYVIPAGPPMYQLLLVPHPHMELTPAENFRNYQLLFYANISAFNAKVVQISPNDLRENAAKRIALSHRVPVRSFYDDNQLGRGVPPEEPTYTLPAPPDEPPTTTLGTTVDAPQWMEAQRLQVALDGLQLPNPLVERLRRRQG